MNKLTFYITVLLSVFLISCQSESNSESNQEMDALDVAEDSISKEERVEVPEFKAVVDGEAMGQVGFYNEVNHATIFDLYHSGQDIVERWTDKLWGRCCTEADLSLCEVMSFKVSTNREGKKYPFENATSSENPYGTAYVFEEKDQVVITITLDLREDQWLGPWEEYGPLSKILGEDTIMKKFQYSLINGYVKSEDTFEENARIEWVEVWLNDEHQCNVQLLDTPEIQMIEGNFPFKKDDVVKIVPFSYYEGSKYDDICISTLQTSLSYSCDLELLKKGDRIAGIEWRGYE